MIKVTTVYNVLEMKKTSAFFFSVFLFFISLIELLVGGCIVFFLLSDRSEDIANSCNMFQIIDFIHHFVMLFFNLVDDKGNIAPRNALYNPDAHNALMIAVYLIFGKIPILYVVDSLIGYLLLMRRSTLFASVHRFLSKVIKEKHFAKAAAIVEILLLVEFIIRLIFDCDVAILFVIALYIVDILMFGYVISYDIRGVWSDIYDFIKNVTRSKQILSICDLIRKITLDLYPTNPIKVHFQ